MHQYKVVEKKFVREGDVVLTTIGESDAEIVAPLVLSAVSAFQMGVLDDESTDFVEFRNQTTMKSDDIDSLMKDDNVKYVAIKREL